MLVGGIWSTLVNLGLFGGRLPPGGPSSTPWS